MANEITSLSRFGNAPSVGGKVKALVSLDTYAAGGIDVGALLDANATFKGWNLAASKVKTGYVNLFGAEGMKYAASFDSATRKVILRGKGAGATLEEVAAGSISAVTAEVVVEID
jgi:hypothetical protein